MKGNLLLYLDQFGNRFFARSVKELRAQIANGKSRVSRMFMTTKQGDFHVGYVIGQHCLTAYCPIQNPIH